MATVTAQILFGTSHPFSGGIDPTYALYLWENDRPAWSLASIDTTSAQTTPTAWIPSPDHMLEDALLILAIQVLKDPGTLSLLGQHLNTRAGFDLNSLGSAKLAALRERCRQIEWKAKIVVTVLGGSSIERYLNVLKEYKVEIEVCLSRRGD